MAASVLPQQCGIKLQVSHLKIRASTLTLALVLKYILCLFHSIKNLKSQNLVLCIFAKQISFSGFAIYRLETCNFVRVGMAKISRTKFLIFFQELFQELFQDLKVALLLKPDSKTSVVESVSIKIAGRDSRPVTMLKRSFRQGGFSCKYIRILSTSS